MTLQLRSYAIVPPVRSGYVIDDVWAVIKPIARTNLCTNPSVETNTTGWAGFGSTAIITRVSTQQYHGVYSLLVSSITATDSVGYNGVALTAGTVYAVSIKVYCPNSAGSAYYLEVQSTSGVLLGRVRFVASGRWQWIVLYYTETSTATRRIHVTTIANGSDFYVDGLQVEAINVDETVSTYIDGDQQGLVPNQFPVPYGWNGTPHASTSYRTGQTRAGGMVLQFRNYGWLLMAIVGLGLATPQNVATEYARLDGGYDDYTRKPTRQFTLTGRFQSKGEYFDLRDQRSQLARLLDRDLVSQDQRLTLLRWMEDGCENNDVRSSYCRVWAKYQGGLEGNTNNHYASEAPITFTNYLPYVVSDGESGTTLSPQTSVTNVNRIALRNAAGTWQALGTGASGGSVYAVVKGLDGKYYIGGDFTSFNGVANTARICSYDPVTGTVAAMGTGVNNQLVIDLQVAPNGYIWAVGPFLNMGGVAAADYVAYWDGSVWNAPGTPPVVASGGPLVPAGGAFDQSGNFYLAAGGTTISKWTAATNTWSSIASGGTGNALCVVLAPDGNMMFAGTLSLVGGVAGGPVYKYTIATGVWTSAGTPGYAVTTLAYDAAARLYAGGSIYLSRYNGVQWINLVTVTGPSPLIAKITFNPVSNLIYVAGSFSGVSGLTPPDSFFVWNGAAALFPDIDLPGTIGTAVVTLVRAFADGSVVVGLDTSGTATAASTTTVTNTGTGYAYPTITITGPTTGTAVLDTLQNVTTGRSIYFSYTINAGETVTITFQPDNLRVVSSFAGNVASAILPGSSEAEFFLQPGANTLVFLASAASVTATLRWRNGYVSLDDVP